MLLSAGVDGFHLFFFYGFLLGEPLQIELDELLQSEGLHVVVIDNVDAEVEQVFAVFLLCGDEGANVQFQLVEHGFVHNAVAVDEMAEESVLLNGGEVFF